MGRLREELRTHYRREIRHRWFGPPLKALLLHTENASYWLRAQAHRIAALSYRTWLWTRGRLAASSTRAGRNHIRTEFYRYARTFYRRHLGHHAVGPPLRAAFIRAENGAIRLRGLTRRRATKSLPDARVCNLADIAEYSDSRNFDSHRIFPAESFALETPSCRPVAHAHVLGAAITDHELCDVTAWHVDGATVVGLSDLVIRDAFTLHHRLYDFTHDGTSEELHSRALISPSKRRITWYENTHASKSIPCGISLLGSCTKNYAHWLTEFLPKLAAADLVPGVADYPLLVDAGLPDNMRASIDFVGMHDREIIEVHPDEPVEVERLVFVDPSGYVPFEPRDKIGIAVRHGVFGSRSIEQMLAQIRRNAGESAERGPERLFLRRNSAHRMVVNERELEAALVDRGFTVIEPEKLDFREQFRLFSGARIIVAATGAACANLVFAPRGTKTVILIARHRQMPYYYWQAMARAVGNDVAYVLGEPVGDEADTIHASYRIEPGDLLELVDDAALPSFAARRHA